MKRTLMWSIVCFLFYSCVYFGHYIGLDFWRFVVLHLVGCWCMDVYSVDIKSVRYIIGSICSCYTAGHLSQYYVNETGQIACCWRLGSIIRYLFATTGWSHAKPQGKSNQANTKIYSINANIKRTWQIK